MVATEKGKALDVLPSADVTLTVQFPDTFKSVETEIEPVALRVPGTLLTMLFGAVTVTLGLAVKPVPVMTRFWAVDETVGFAGVTPLMERTVLSAADVLVPERVTQVALGEVSLVAHNLAECNPVLVGVKRTVTVDDAPTAMENGTVAGVKEKDAASAPSIFSEFTLSEDFPLFLSVTSKGEVALTFVDLKTTVLSGDKARAPAEVKGSVKFSAQFPGPSVWVWVKYPAVRVPGPPLRYSTLYFPRGRDVGVRAELLAS